MIQMCALAVIWSHFAVAALLGPEVQSPTVELLIRERAKAGTLNRKRFDRAAFWRGRLRLGP